MLRSMGALDEGHYDVVLENGVKFEKDGDEIEVAVKVLLEGLGEDVNREGLVKTPLRVAKALRDGTRGYLSFFYMFCGYAFYHLKILCDFNVGGVMV